MADDEVVVAGGHHLVHVAVELGEGLADGVEAVRRSAYVMVGEVAAARGEVERDLALPAVEDRDGEAARVPDGAERARCRARARRGRAAARARPR